MKIFLLSALILTSVYGASPTVEEPQMPNTGVSVEEVNPSPNPAPGNAESEEFRGTLSTGKKDAPILRQPAAKKKEKRTRGKDHGHQ